jgi:hypothetical protein
LSAEKASDMILGMAAVAAAAAAAA